MLNDPKLVLLVLRFCANEIIQYVLSYRVPLLTIVWHSLYVAFVIDCLLSLYVLLWDYMMGIWVAFSYWPLWIVLNACFIRTLLSHNLYDKICLVQVYNPVCRFAFSGHFINWLVHMFFCFCAFLLSIRFLRSIYVVACINIFIPVYGNTPFDLFITWSTFWYYE